jgi:hypothetical protein
MLREELYERTFFGKKASLKLSPKNSGSSPYPPKVYLGRYGDVAKSLWRGLWGKPFFRKGPPNNSPLNITERR